MRQTIRRLERASRGEMISIKQLDGSVKRFPQSALAEAFVNNCERLCGEDIPPHPLSVAATNSSDPRWRESLAYSTQYIIGPDGIEYDPVEHGPPEDLSEQALQSESDDAR